MKNERFNKKLLVEGNDECYVITKLMERLNSPIYFDIVDCKGVDGAITQFKNRLKILELNTLAIIVDADDNLQSRWEAIRNRLIENEFNPPKQITKKGLIYKEENKTTIGVWIMPNNNLTGMFEDFISFLIPLEDKLLPYVKDVVKDIEVKKIHKYKPSYTPKAIINAWLTFQDEPGKGMGLAITKKLLDANSEECNNFVKWLNNLFNNEGANSHIKQ